jgi:hypothetical protein
MRMVPVLAGLVFALLASPALAHHKPGHHIPPGLAKKENQTNGDQPPAGPGNSGAAHWCKANWQKKGYFNHGQCVSHYAHLRHTADDDDEDKNEDKQDKKSSKKDKDKRAENLSELEITEYAFAPDGTFVLRGVGATEPVTVSIGGVSGLVAGFADAVPDAEGRWEAWGEWACDDASAAYEARVRAFTADERVSKVATFPCSEAMQI